MTPPVMLLVELLNAAVMRYPFDWRDLGELAWRVFVVSLLVMTVRALVWRQPAAVVETRTIVAPPLPEAEAVFRRRLPARVRAARLIAIEAHDHYLKVHTDAGCELITARFGDALAELSAAYGFRTHRSWWVAADTIEAVRWSRGTGTAKLTGGIIAPVSRAQSAALRNAGW
jgi:DNA-binding LytR/AlgR family response regulator